MFKLAKISLAVLVLVAMPVAANAADSAYSSTKTIVVASGQNTNIYASKLTKLANGNVLASWLSQENDSSSIKTRLVLANNKLKPVVKIADLNFNGFFIQDSFSVVASSNGNKVFATWLVQTIVAGRINQKVMGATSLDGFTWSKPFTMIPKTAFGLVDSDCRDMEDNICGFRALTGAVDGLGNLAIVVTKPVESRKAKFFAVVGTPGKFSKPQRIGSVEDSRGVSILGLDKGFITNHMKYSSGSTCGVYTSHWNASTQAWSSPLAATFAGVNTVIHSQWVQRDSGIATLVFASEVLKGGLYFRDFNLSTGKWIGLSKNIAEPREDLVYQNISASSKGGAIVLSFVTYDRTLGKSSANIAMQQSVGEAYKWRKLNSNPDQVDQLLVSFASKDIPLVVVQGSGLGQTVFKGYNAKPATIPLYSNQNYAQSAVLVNGNLLYTLTFSSSDDDYQLGIVKGLLK